MISVIAPTSSTARWSCQTILSQARYGRSIRWTQTAWRPDGHETRILFLGYPSRCPTLKGWPARNSRAVRRRPPWR